MKKIAPTVLERSNGLCEICSGNQMVQLHHIVKGRGKRKQHETAESIIALCWDCHYSNDGIHGKNGKKLDTQLKQQLQDTYSKQGYSEDEVRRMLGGRLY